MADDPKVALRCDKLHRYLGRDEGRVHVLKGVSFEARAGSVYAIVGPSGCGKSTLLYLLGLLDQPDSGEIWINGQLMSNSVDAIRTAARGEHIGFVFQFHFLMLEFTALENVMMPMRKLGRLEPKAMEERATQLLDSVGLADKINRIGTHLSGGEQQRVCDRPGPGQPADDHPRRRAHRQPGCEERGPGLRHPDPAGEGQWTGGCARDAQPRHRRTLRRHPAHAGRSFHLTARVFRD